MKRRVPGLVLVLNLVVAGWPVIADAQVSRERLKSNQRNGAERRRAQAKPPPIGRHREKERINEPISATSPRHPLDKVQRLSFEAIDRAVVAEEDETREIQGLAPRYAIPIPVLLTPQNSGTWEDLAEGSRVWRLRLTAKDADSINLGFTRFDLPAGAQLLVYSADHGHVLRPFTDDDHESHGQLWTPPVPSDDVVIELRIAETAIPKLDLVLTSVNYGYRPFGRSGLSGLRSGSCNVDVICPQGDPWRIDIQAVGVISTGGSTFCTGFMVNNTDQDLTPFFMTANHCGINSGNAASLVVFWNYENSTCRPPGSPASGGPGDGLLTTFQTGSFFRASFGSSDMTLVELDDDPNPAWNVSFAGWDRSPGDHAGAVGIHHPNTDEKRISFENDPTATSSYLGTSSPGDGTHVRIIDWDLGTTEPGSSGSPLFNQDHRIIGQLHGGGAACGNNDSDYYGRFSLSWTGGGTDSSRLSNWLDPSSTGATSIDTISGGGMTVAPSGDVDHLGLAGGPFTNPTVVYTLSNQTPDPVDYDVSLTADFGVLLDGGSGPLSGTLSASGGTVNVTVTLGPAIDALSIGEYLEDIVFEDITHSLTTTRRHRVEVGLTLISVTPTNSLVTGGPVGGPFLGQQTYTITSERPTPVDVQVATGESWILLNGLPGPQVVSLNGTGDFAGVTVSIGPDADLLPAGVYSSNVVFTNLNDGGGDTSRMVMLDVGRIVNQSTDVPKTISDFSTATSVINVTENYCIGDLDVEVDITHTYVGDLIVELESPEGTVVRLHNQTGGSSDDLILTYDDEGTPPDGPGALSAFDLEASMGTWTLSVSDEESGDTGTLNTWALRLAPLGGVCPPRANNTTAYLSPGVPVDVVLQGSSTSGGTLVFTIESLPQSGNLADPNGGMIAAVPYTLLADGNIVQYIPVEPTPSPRGTAQPIYAYPLDVDSFQFSVDDGIPSTPGTVSIVANPQWSTAGQWALGIPTGAGSNGGDPTAAHTGLVIYGYNLNGDYTDNLSVQYLTTTAMDCSTLEDAELRFWRKLGVESSQFDHATVQVSNNGSSWTTVWNHTGGSFNDAAWNQQTLNISAIADGQSTVYVRWGMGPTDGSVTYPGWNLDDVELWGVVTGPPVLPPLAGTGSDGATKSRFVTFQPNNPGVPVNFRVTHLDSGRAMWVAAPAPGPEALNNVARLVGDGTPGTAPAPRVWTELVLNVGDCLTAPAEVYEIRATADNVNFSSPLFLVTTPTPIPKFWGDTNGPFISGLWTPPDAQVNFTDVAAVVQRFQNLSTAPPLVWTDLEPARPNLLVNFADIDQLIRGFQGLAYPFQAPAGCP